MKRGREKTKVHSVIDTTGKSIGGFDKRPASATRQAQGTGTLPTWPPKKKKKKKKILVLWPTKFNREEPLTAHGKRRREGGLSPMVAMGEPRRGKDAAHYTKDWSPFYMLCL